MTHLSPSMTCSPRTPGSHSRVQIRAYKHQPGLPGHRERQRRRKRGLQGPGQALPGGDGPAPALRHRRAEGLLRPDHGRRSRLGRWKEEDKENCVH